MPLDCIPNIYQIFIESNNNMSDEEFETALLQSRKFIEEIYLNDEKLYFCSFSAKTIIYKGLMLPSDIKNFYIDLQSKQFTSSICVFHQRFSTNTSPRWHLAQPFRLLAHNGEINAIRGNRNWSRARSNIFETTNIPKIQKFKQIVNETGSDSSALDNMLEILVSGGINILKSIRMIIPPAWQNAQIIDPDVRSFHEYNSMHMEPWDGPAGIVMSDGKWAICVLDRNGLRPARYQIDNLNNITIASETGVNPVHDENIKSKRRISPGGLLAINTENSEILSEKDVDSALKNGATYRRWLKDNAIYIESSLDKYEGPDLKKLVQKNLKYLQNFFTL